MSAEVVDDENGNSRRLSDKELREIALNLIIAGMYLIKRRNFFLFRFLYL